MDSELPPNGMAPWLEERLFDQRIVLLQGSIDQANATRAAAALLTLDAMGIEPIRLHLSARDGDLNAVFAVIDAVDMLHAPVRAVATGEVGGAAIGVLVAAPERLAYPHARITLAEPKVSGIAGKADEVAAAAGRYLQSLEDLVLRIVATTGQPRSKVEDDLAAGKVLNAEEAREYGLVESIVAPGKA